MDISRNGRQALHKSISQQSCLEVDKEVFDTAMAGMFNVTEVF
jgi:hypothetical protein